MKKSCRNFPFELCRLNVATTFRHLLTHQQTYSTTPSLSRIITPATVEPTVHQTTYQWHEGVEDIEGYVRGGYHPVLIGEKYRDGRYEILHKLGFGSYSTVWLARDSKENKLVAIKFIVADASKRDSESVILSRLASGPADHPGRANVASSVADEFYFSGPNGHHRCTVTDAAGCSIAQSKECSLTWKFPVHIARAIAAQVLRGLAYVHSCGVVHADLHIHNVLFKKPRFLPSSSTDDLYNRIGKPQRLPVQRLDKQPLGPEAPQYCVPPAIIVQPAEEVANAEVIIVDFGESFLCQSGESRHGVKLRTPVLLLPPESIFNEDVGQAIDVWTAVSTIYEILGERPLFEGFMSDEDQTVAEMISTLGPLPKKWWNNWPARKDFFLDDGSWKQDTTRSHDPCSRPLYKRLRTMGRGSGAETDEFKSYELLLLEGLLRSMLTYEPTERVTSSVIQRDAWMVEYGIPVISQTVSR